MFPRAASASFLRRNDVRPSADVCLDRRTHRFLAPGPSCCHRDLRPPAELVGGVSPDLLHLFCLPGGKASRAGQAGFPQHTQEANGLPAGPAERGCGQEVCQVPLGEHQQPPTSLDHMTVESTRAHLSPETPTPDRSGGWKQSQTQTSWLNECGSCCLVYLWVCLGVSDTELFCVFDCAQKKLPLTTLAQCMVEGAAVLGDESLLG